MLPNDLANVWIVSAKAAKGATTADFNSGKAAIGTGPYKLVEWVNGERLVVERNDRYWGPKPHWAKVTERVIAKDPTRLAALLRGRGRRDRRGAHPGPRAPAQGRAVRALPRAPPRWCTTWRSTRPATSLPS